CRSADGAASPPSPPCLHSGRRVRSTARTTLQDRHRAHRAAPFAPRQSLVSLLDKIDELRELSATAFIAQRPLGLALCRRKWPRGRSGLFAIFVGTERGRRAPAL